MAFAILGKKKIELFYLVYLILANSCLREVAYKIPKRNRKVHTLVF